MPAEDKIHEAVKNALVKDGWSILSDPFVLQFGTDRLYADIKIGRIGEDNDEQILVVEVKSFAGKSLLHALEGALGQYQIYRNILQVLHPEYDLYLALPTLAYNELKGRTTFQQLLGLKQLALIVINTESEEIAEWID